MFGMKIARIINKMDAIAGRQAPRKPRQTRLESGLATTRRTAQRRNQND
jgi:hypothetical protein